MALYRCSQLSQKVLRLTYSTDVQWVHVLALMGDASDNVPGVSGIGAKGALSLIQEYGSVESVLENAEKVRHMATTAVSASLQIKPYATIRRPLH